MATPIEAFPQVAIDHCRRVVLIGLPSNDQSEAALALHELARPRPLASLLHLPLGILKATGFATAFALVGDEQIEHDPSEAGRDISV